MKHKQFGKPYMVRLFLDDEQKLSRLSGRNTSEKIRNAMHSFLKSQDEGR
jgi:hypothetical protein